MNKKASMNFLTNLQEGRSTFRLINVLVYGWVGGKNACAYLIGVSVLVGLGARSFTMGQAAYIVTSSKMTKHDKMGYDNQHIFIIFFFYTFSFLAPEVVDLL